MPEDFTTGGPAPKDKASVDPHNQLRVRAAWMYYIEGMTQSDVAKRLGVNRIMITRLLSEAKKRSEVQIRIKSDIAPLVALQAQLEDRFGLAKAIIAPFSDPTGDPGRVIAAAAGAYVSGLMRANMTVAWDGGAHCIQCCPISKGGTSKGCAWCPCWAASVKPSVSTRLNSRGNLLNCLMRKVFWYLPQRSWIQQTKHALLEHCGLEQVFQMAETCDVALLSCGGISTLTTSYRLGHVTEAERKTMIDANAVGDILYNFLDRDGRPIDHPINDRAISMPLDRLSRVPNKVVISGGPEKVDVLLGTLKSVQPNTFVTDELTAQALLTQ